MTTTTNREAALAIIRELAPAGHAYAYIAKALDLAGIPTLSGRPRDTLGPQNSPPGGEGSRGSCRVRPRGRLTIFSAVRDSNLTC
jgi:hypothetical protein